jgi:hypothetical protein
MGKSRPPRIYVSETGQKYILLNGKKVKIRTNMKNKQLVNVVINNLLNKKRYRRKKPRKPKNKLYEKNAQFATDKLRSFINTSFPSTYPVVQTNSSPQLPPSPTYPYPFFYSFDNSKYNPVKSSVIIEEVTDLKNMITDTNNTIKTLSTKEEVKLLTDTMEDIDGVITNMKEYQKKLPEEVLKYILQQESTKKMGYDDETTPNNNNNKKPQNNNESVELRVPDEEGNIRVIKVPKPVATFGEEMIKKAENKSKKELKDLLDTKKQLEEQIKEKKEEEKIKEDLDKQERKMNKERELQKERQLKIERLGKITSKDTKAKIVEFAGLDPKIKTQSIDTVLKTAINNNNKRVIDLIDQMNLSDYGTQIKDKKKWGKDVEKYINSYYQPPEVDETTQPPKVEVVEEPILKKQPNTPKNSISSKINEAVKEATPKKPTTPFTTKTSTYGYSSYSTPTKKKGNIPIKQPKEDEDEEKDTLEKEFEEETKPVVKPLNPTKVIPKTSLDQDLEDIKMTEIDDELKRDTADFNSTDKLYKDLMKNVDATKGKGKVEIGGLYDYQIEQIMKPFKPKGFLGVISIDEINTLLPKINNQNVVSFIMNTVPSNIQNGHWVAIYIDKKNDGTVEYYDSFASDPSDQFMKDIKLVISKLKPESYLRFKVNKIIDQRSNSDNCGLFAMKFLMDRYEGKPFKDCTGFSDVLKSEKKIKKFKYMLEKYNYI